MKIRDVIFLDETDEEDALFLNEIKINWEECLQGDDVYFKTEKLSLPNFEGILSQQYKLAVEDKRVDENFIYVSAEKLLKQLPLEQVAEEATYFDAKNLYAECSTIIQSRIVKKYFRLEALPEPSLADFKLIEESKTCNELLKKKKLDHFDSEKMIARFLYYRVRDFSVERSTLRAFLKYYQDIINFLDEAIKAVLHVTIVEFKEDSSYSRLYPVISDIKAELETTLKDLFKMNSIQFIPLQMPKEQYDVLVSTMPRTIVGDCSAYKIRAAQAASCAAGVVTVGYTVSSPFVMGMTAITGFFVGKERLASAWNSALEVAPVAWDLMKAEGMWGFACQTNIISQCKVLPQVVSEEKSYSLVSSVPQVSQEGFVVCYTLSNATLAYCERFGRDATFTSNSCIPVFSNLKAATEFAASIENTARLDPMLGLNMGSDWSLEEKRQHYSQHIMQQFSREKLARILTRTGLFRGVEKIIADYAVLPKFVLK